MIDDQFCPYFEQRKGTAWRLVQEAAIKVRNQEIPKINTIWLETTGCSGNIISFLNAGIPNAYDALTSIVNLTFSNSIMGDEGEAAYEQFLDTLNSDFILLVDGAISTKDNGVYTIVANYKGQYITSYDAVRMAGEKAKYVVAVGTCASYGGISAAKPNPAGCKSVSDVLNRQVIKLPTCPCHPDWLIGTVAHLTVYGMPELDSDGRPLIFYNHTIHDTCTRRGLFDAGIFAKSFGEEGCMFQIGCKGPITTTECPRRRWNSSVNWPIGNNTNCIGCGHPQFPDGSTQPFVNY